MNREGRAGLTAGIVLAFLGLFGALAHGDALPDGMRIERGKGALADKLVVGPPFAGVVPLPEGGVSALDDVRFDRATQKVTIRYQTRCGAAAKAVIPLAVLEARVGNVVGLLALAQHRYADAAERFEHAAALDPEMTVARTNLASARMRAGDQPGALRALAPVVADTSAWLYWKVLTDTDLAPLIDTAPIAALRAPRAGTTKLSEKDVPRIRGYVATAAGLVAVGNSEGSWGGCSASYELVVFGARDGKRLLSLPLGSDRETGDEHCPPAPGRDKHLAVANRFLADLGFSAPADMEVGALSVDVDRQVTKLYFEKARLGLVQSAVLRLLSGDRELARYDAVEGKPSFARLLPASRAIAVGWERPGREGCETVDPRGVVVLPLPEGRPPTP